MIFSIIGICIALLGFVNFKKGFLIFLIFKLFLVNNITLISVPGIPLLTLDMFLSLYFVALFCYNKLIGRINKKNRFPLGLPFLYIVISSFLSTVFAYAGFLSALSSFVGIITQEIILVWIIWAVVDVEDIPFLVKGMTYSFFVIVLYGIIEHFLEYNPLVNYEATLIEDETRSFGTGYGTDWDARGYRAQSVFEHPIGGGINCALYNYWMLLLLYKDKMLFKIKYLILLTLFLSILFLLFTNSRGPILFAVITLLFFARKILTSFKLIALFALIIIALMFFLPEYGDFFMSFISRDAQDEVGGSNAEGRFSQLAAAIALMQKSPIFGLGYKFDKVLESSFVDDLLGMESMWFQILTMLGLLGVAVNLFLAYYMLVKIPRQYGSSAVFFVSLAYWIVGSLTSVPGMKMYLYYLIIIMILKSAKQTKAGNISLLYKRQIKSEYGRC